MNTTPTPEQFLAMQTTEDDDTEAAPASPLESIAESLRTIAAGMGGETFTAELVGEHHEAACPVLEECDDWQAKHAEVWEVLAQVEKIVSKSTSKVSLDVKAAINAWRKPEVETVVAPPETQRCENCQGSGCESCNGVGEWEETPPADHITKAERERMSAEATAGLPGRSPYDA